VAIELRHGDGRYEDRRTTANGLPILDGWPGLDRFFYDTVIGGPGAFVEAARGFKDIYYAIRRKMIREIAGAPEAGPETVKVTQR